MFRQSAKEDQKCRYRFKVRLIFFLTISLSVIRLVALAQTVYYVAATGSDSNNGTTIGTPFQSLAKVNGLALGPGDQVLFRRGDTFRGTLMIRRSGSAGMPITFDAYGSGLKPVIAGSVPVTGWASVGNNVWQASCSSCGDAINGLYKNGAALPLGRYPNADGPNKGNLTIRAHTERYQIFSQEHLPTSIDWKGAEVVMRPAPWIIDRAVVDAQFGDALNLFNYSSYFPKDNSEYFFQNHPATLDKNGEWCYNSSTKKITIYSESGTPANDLYTATIHSRGVDIASVSYITLRNLQIVETLNTNFIGYNVSNLTVTDINITNAGEDGVLIHGSGNNILFEKNKITDVNNNGIWIEPYKTVTIRNNVMRRIGLLAGRGKSGDGQYNGLTSKADLNVLIENNTIDSVGYNGITFANNTVIKQNVIANYCFIKIDGGGIYAWNGNKSPMSNIRILSNILYTKPPGNTPWVDYAIGIFLDDCVTNVEVKGNTVFGNTQWGVFLHGANHVTFTDNTLFDNNTCQLIVYHNGGSCPIRGHIIKRNVIVSKAISQLVAQYESYADDLQQYGLIDSNYYARPFNEEGTIRGIKNLGYGGNFKLADWSGFSAGHDTHSKSSPITYGQYKNEGSGGINRVFSNFEGGNNDWQLVYSRYNNAEMAYDNTNKLDGGSLRVSFPTPSGQSGSYAQIAKPIGAIVGGRTYVLRFDAIATTDVPVLMYLRQYGAPYHEFDRRYSVPIGPTRKSYELVFTANNDEANAIVMVQTDTEAPVFWIDNVRLQEGISIQNNPDDFVKLYYNPTLSDSTIILPAGAFRDVKNQTYSNSLLLKPFTSVILLKDTVSVPPADLSLSLYSDKRVVQVDELTTMRLRIRNEGNATAELARWTYRLPANIEFIRSDGQPFSDNVLTGTVNRLLPQSDTTFSMFVKPRSAGLFRMAAQLTTATSPDPDSTPNTGTNDGEDDAAVAELRVEGAPSTIFNSPDPNPRLLPGVLSNQPVADPGVADLSLRVITSKRIVVAGEVVSYSLTVSNAGGRSAEGIQIQNVLPEGVEVVDAAGWAVGGRTMNIVLASIQAGSTSVVSFQVRVTASGMLINQAQINASSVADPDSTPGNGFTNGEDDQVQTDILVR